MCLPVHKSISDEAEMRLLTDTHIAFIQQRACTRCKFSSILLIFCFTMFKDSCFDAPSANFDTCHQYHRCALIGDWKNKGNAGVQLKYQ